MIFRQLFESQSSTYTYLLADADTKDAILIDPVIETVDRDIQLIKDLDLKLLYTLDTHVHADHITGASEIKKRLNSKIAIGSHSGATGADLLLKDNQEIKFGAMVLKAIETPGHTDGCMSFYCNGMVFTGDALLIGGSGRTDFQQGSSAKLYKSVTDKLYKLPNDTLVYPAHDYKGFTSSSIGFEKKKNSRIGLHTSESEFIKTMNELKLTYPKKINEALPANLNCGIINQKSYFSNLQIVDGIFEITPEDLFQNKLNVKIIDVRSKDEFHSELGHIEGAILKTLGLELEIFLESIEDKNQEIVFVCRSGGRSGAATRLSIQKGFKKTINMSGGMLSWNQHGFPIQK